MPPLLSFEAVHKYRFFRDVRGRVAWTEALADVSFDLFPGERLVLAGPDGSGKTTLLRLIPRFEDATAGRMLWCGTDLRHVPLAELRGRLGYVPEHPSLFGETVEDNVAYGLRLRGLPREAARERSRVAVERAGLDGFFLDRKVGSLSLPQARRVSLARALAVEPELLLVDELHEGEPGAGDLLAGLDGKLTVLATTRHPGLARVAGDRVRSLVGGRLAEELASGDLVSDASDAEGRRRPDRR
jgi:ABC-type methionine transport system ATPase subunit